MQCRIAYVDVAQQEADCRISKYRSRRRTIECHTIEVYFAGRKGRIEANTRRHSYCAIVVYIIHTTSYYYQLRCNVCNLFMDTDGMDQEEVRKVEYDHRADPAHVTRREKLRKRFGIVTAFNREIERVKGHRVKLGPECQWQTAAYVHHPYKPLSSVSGAPAVTSISSRPKLSISTPASTLIGRIWSITIGALKWDRIRDCTIKLGWHFPAKDSPKEECALPKLDDMKTEDISYLTKGEAAGANYCCRCNVTLASPWEIRQHLRTRSHRERAAVGYTVDERPPLIELEADISLKEYDDDDDDDDVKAEVKTEACDDENMAEVDRIPTQMKDIPDIDREIEEVWGVDQEASSSDAADGGEGGDGIVTGGEVGASEELPSPLSGMDRQPTADEFDMMVSSIINGEELISSSSSAYQQQQLLSE
ncbi:hypothetical protein FOZ60_015477 [Perkinsus olseni]|uniref:Uncharacterized protein n=1 Tax=Perkinsus olseni TaxID=32597 RepID=A0A7J6N5B8_PEROL|nr:hypothetical protein FOZ60_015477 [Perkinsus olseni]